MNPETFTELLELIRASNSKNTHWSSVINHTYCTIVQPVVQPCCESVYIVVCCMLAVARIKHV